VLTIVTLNWARPELLLGNLRLYAGYGIVDRVLCFNNGVALKAGRLPPKCVVVEASEDLGLYSRLAIASLSRTEAVFHTDDDLRVPESTLAALYSCWLGAPGACHGLFGRIARPRYQPGNVYGPVEVVLTRAMMCGRRVNNAALSATPLFEDLRGAPHGNGEDIILSFAAMATSRTLNLAYSLPSHDHQPPDETAIHRRWNGHFEHRQLMVERCRKVFGV
jgi:hypothetical protein